MEMISQLWTLSIAAIAALAGSCFAVLSPPQYLDRTVALCITFVGVSGTAFVASKFLAFSRRPPTWDGLGFRRNVVLGAICLAWLFGGIGGIAVFYASSTFVVGISHSKGFPTYQRQSRAWRSGTLGCPALPVSQESHIQTMTTRLM